MRNKKEISIKEDIMRKAKNIADTFDKYTIGVNLLMLIFRAKEGAQSANNDKLRKIIVTNKQEFINGLYELLETKERMNLPLRIYSSVNSRDMEKAIRQFKFEQLNADYYDVLSRHAFYFDIKNRFIGTLMTPTCRAETKFLLDVDDEKSQNESLKKLAELDIEILDVFKTKNGYHILTKPFNPNLFTIENVEIKKDAMLLLDY